MEKLLKYTGYVLILVIVGFLIWKFFYIIGWILAAAVLSFIGQPLVRLFDRIHYKRFRIPHSLSTLLSLLVIVLIFILIIATFVPLILNQAETISKIDVGKLEKNLESPLQWIDVQAHNIGAIPDTQTIQDFVVSKVKSIVNLGSVGKVIGAFFNAAGSIFVGFFSIMFIAFFFLKDENMFEEGVLLLVPEKNHAATRRIIEDSKKLLMRYFIGVSLEVLGVMLLISLGLWILGVKNALLIGFLGGIMNIIPYLGPVIGTAIALALGITDTLALGTLNDLPPQVIKIAGVMFVVNFIDNNVLVPIIYSQSVKSHPLEIFFVIIMGGGLAGLLGMLLAIPVYTVLRVVAKEFLQQFRMIRKLTDTMD